MYKNIKLSASLMCVDWLNLKSQILDLDDLAVKGIQARGNKVSSKSVQSVKLIKESMEEQESLPFD